MDTFCCIPLKSKLERIFPSHILWLCTSVKAKVGIPSDFRNLND